MASSTLGRRSTWTEGDKAIAAKYPANFHPEIIALREKNIKSRKSRELLKDDIGVLERRKFCFRKKYFGPNLTLCSLLVHPGFTPSFSLFKK